MDLDFNGHVNNRVYLSLAMQTAAIDYMAEHYPEHIIIQWLREGFLGDVMSCKTGVIDHNEFLHHVVKEDGTIAALVYSKWQPVGELQDICECAVRI